MAEDIAVPDLYRLAFMPGCFRCPKCGFILTTACINSNLEVIGTREQDRESEPCPNDGTLMVHVTYREQLAVYAERLKEEVDRIDRIRSAIVAVFGGMGQSSAIWGNSQWDKGWTAGIRAALTAFDTARDVSPDVPQRVGTEADQAQGGSFNG